MIVESTKTLKNYGINAEKELTSILSKYLSDEINKSILNNLILGGITLKRMDKIKKIFN